MFISAQKIDVKSSQDFVFSDFKNQSLLICDGIGDFSDSGIVAKFLIDEYSKQNSIELESLVQECLKKIKQNKIIGGTTLIHARLQDQGVSISYLGNGGAISLGGNFFDNPISNFPYKFTELINPHINVSNELFRHLSHNSSIEELRLSKITMNLNHPNGDILLFYSDGITSLEEKLILKDEEERYWRAESKSLIIILNELDIFLRTLKPEPFQDQLEYFNLEILEKLKAKELLEDDASLGIMISQKVLDYYQQKEITS